MRSRLRGLAALLVFAGMGAQVAYSSPASAYPKATVELSGHGFGHGRGLSQYGSLGYALAGASYTDILNTYYSNTTMGSIGNVGIGIRLISADNVDLIVTANNNFTVGSVTVPANAAARVRKTGSNAFAIDQAQGCAGEGGWNQVGTATGPVAVQPPSSSPGNNLALMIQRCAPEGTRGYRGSLQTIDDNGTQRTVNAVTLEDYLRGVVPRESPASWGDLGSGAGMNALKAQSVAARSYVVSSASYSYATSCDTISCQVYGGAYLNGAYIEDARTNTAISQTAGQVRMLNGAVARTEFSSSSGGYTAGGTFPAVVDDGDSVSYNPNHNWTVSIPVTTVEAAYPSIGSLASISINSRNGLGDLGGRVALMSLIGSSGTVNITGADFRAKLGLKSDWFQVTNSASGGVSGYWMLGQDGGVFSFGNAEFFGSAGRLNKPIVGGAARADATGYWLAASDGGIFSFGATQFYGSAGNIRLNQPVVGMAATPNSGGYWMVASDGGIFAYGNAAFFGSTGGTRLNKPVVAMASTPSGNGYWLVASDGGVFAYGDAQFYGSTGDIALRQPVVGIASTPTGKGYWLVAADGGIFAFGDANYYGSLPGSKVTASVAGIASTKSGGGYIITTTNGVPYSFGDAPQFGSVPSVIPGFKGRVVGVAQVFE